MYLCNRKLIANPKRKIQQKTKKVEKTNQKRKGEVKAPAAAITNYKLQSIEMLKLKLTRIARKKGYTIGRLLSQRAHGRGADNHGLMLSAPYRQLPVFGIGEDVAERYEFVDGSRLG